MVEKIWVVLGTTGEYSERSEWVVDAWRSEAEAQDRVEFLKSRMHELGIGAYDRYGTKYEAACVEMRKEDACFSNDYTGTEWYVSATELKP